MDHNLNYSTQEYSLFRAHFTVLQCILIILICPQGTWEAGETCDYVAIAGIWLPCIHLQSLAVMTLGGTLKLGPPKLEISWEDEPC